MPTDDDDFTVTARYGLMIPKPDSQNWGPLFEANFQKIDALFAHLSGRIRGLERLIEHQRQQIHRLEDDVLRLTPPQAETPEADAAA